MGTWVVHTCGVPNTVDLCWADGMLCMFCEGAGGWEAGLLKLLPLLCECVEVAGGSMALHPDFHEVEL